MFDNIYCNLFAMCLPPIVLKKFIKSIFLCGAALPFHRRTDTLISQEVVSYFKTVQGLLSGCYRLHKKGENTTVRLVIRNVQLNH